MLLDIPTSFIFIITFSFAIAAMFAIAAQGQYRSLLVCALSPALSGVAYVLFALRGHVSDLVSIVLANMVMTSAFSVYAEAIFAFQERRPPRWLIWSPVGLTGLLFAVLIGPQYLQTRIILAAVLLTFLCVLMTQALWQQRARTVGRGQYIFIAGALILATSLLARLAGIASGYSRAGALPDPGVLQSQVYLASVISLVFCAMGLIMMRMERAEHLARTVTQALVKSEAQYRTLIESANEGVCIRQDGYLRFANDKICELMGYSREEIIGRYFLEFVHEDDREMATRYYAQRLVGDDLRETYALRLLTRHEGTRWFEVNGATFEWDGRPATLIFLNDITERKLLGEQVERMAYLDPLTALSNRRALMDHLQREMVVNKRSGRHGALLFMDLDNFKPLNDTHGHGVGDQLLVQVGQRLTAGVRDVDFVARFGGDEFVVILGGLDSDAAQAQQQALRVAEKIRAALAEPYRLNPMQGDGAQAAIEHSSNTSIGVVMFRDEAGTGEQLLQRADAAMYGAKRAGKGRVNLA